MVLMTARWLRGPSSRRCRSLLRSCFLPCSTVPWCTRKIESEYGLVCSFNPTFPTHGSRVSGWISQDHFALDQGPVILMIENYRSGLIWRLMRSCPYVALGLRRAGFKGGWLTGLAPTAPSFESRNRAGGL